MFLSDGATGEAACPPVARILPPWVARTTSNRPGCLAKILSPGWRHWTVSKTFQETGRMPAFPVLRRGGGRRPPEVPRGGTDHVSRESLNSPGWPRCPPGRYGPPGIDNPGSFSRATFRGSCAGHETRRESGGSSFGCEAAAIRSEVNIHGENCPVSKGGGPSRRFAHGPPGAGRCPGRRVRRIGRCLGPDGRGPVRAFPRPGQGHGLFPEVAHG